LAEKRDEGRHDSIRNERAGHRRAPQRHAGPSQGRRRHTALWFAGPWLAGHRRTAKGRGIVLRVLELMPASRGWPRVALAGIALMFLIACGLAVWQRSKAAEPTLALVPPDVPVAPDAGREPEPRPPDAGNIETPPALPALPAVATFPAYVAHDDEREPAPAAIENAERLGYYFGKLTLTELGVPGAITRAGHWGDSVIGGDGLTEAIRRKLQSRFGDAGHGFHIMGKYNRWYHHRGVRYQEMREWDSCLIIFKCQRQTMRYGYGGVTSTSRGKALSRFETMPKNPPPGIGDKVSRFELWYQKRPDGGGFEIRVDGRVAKVVDTRAPSVGDEVETLHVPDGEHRFDVAAVGSGVAHAYGVVMERDGPGVVWDELSLIGSFTQRLDYQNGEHLAGQIKRRDVDLMVFMFGGNDLSREHGDLKRDTDPYEREYARVIRKFRAGKPEASCLIMALTDHALRVGDAIVSRVMVARLAAAQRRVARAEGCAFYDTFGAMGGAGTVERWRKAKPPLAAPDLRHPTVAGQRHIAVSLYRALMKAYGDYRRRHEGQPLPSTPAADTVAAR
jgi:lysophospholipase L1-like esterase